MLNVKSVEEIVPLQLPLSWVNLLAIAGRILGKVVSKNRVVAVNARFIPAPV